MRNSKIVVAGGIKLDRGHSNVLTYSTSDMLTLLYSEALGQADNYSFIRNRGTISTNFTYTQVVNSNYMAFQNPDYDNKWFFGFIDEAIYISDVCTEIKYTIDAFTTFYDDWIASPCMVLREHSNTDVFGENTQPEPVSFENIKANNKDIIDLSTMRVAWLYSKTEDSQGLPTPQTFNNLYTGLGVGGGVPVSDPSSITAVIRGYLTGETNSNNLINLYQYPSVFGDLTGLKTVYSANKDITRNSDIDGYIPKNKKLFTYPYNYLFATNNQGKSNIYRYELFSNPDSIKFYVEGIGVPKVDVIVTPKNYRGLAFDYDNAIELNDFPQCAWTSDSFKEWLGANKTNIAITGISDTIALAGAAATGNPLALGGALLKSGTDIANIAQSAENANKAANPVHGSIASTNLNSAIGLTGFAFYKMSCTAEYARLIDTFMSRYGYATNKIKTANLSGRPVWNYVQISNDSNIGYGPVPSLYMEEINNIFRQGVTLWHSHANLGNFNLDNSIVEE